MNVANAFVCTNCDSLGTNSACCEYCLSFSLWPLKAWLKEMPQERTRIVQERKSEPCRHFVPARQNNGAMRRVV